MSYLKDLLHYNSGNECPENYLIFGGLALIGGVVNRKVYLDWPPNRIYPNLYVILVGDQGSRKGVAKQCVYNALVQHFPSTPRGASSSTTPQAITKRLNEIDCTVAFRDEKGVATDVHAMFFCASELKNLLGVNLTGMIDFFTEAYDEVYLEFDYKNTGCYPVERPYINIVACETKDWILERLKSTLISGGFARRILLVHETKIRTPIPTPYVTDEMQASYDRLILKLKAAAAKVGRMVLSPSADKIYTDWYMTHFANPPGDPLMKGFHSSHHTQVLKVATLLTLVDREEMVIDDEILLVSMQLVKNLIPGMQELFSGAGRNVLAVPTQRLLQWLTIKGGRVLEKEFRMFADRDMDPREAETTFQHLLKTDQIIIGVEKNASGIDKKYIFTPERFSSRKKEIESARGAQPSAPPPPTSSEKSPGVDPPSEPSEG